MKKSLFILALALAATAALAQEHNDTLTAHVATTISGSTRDLAKLEVRLFTLTTPALLPADADQLLIVKDGRLRVTCGSISKILGPGGIALAAAGDRLSLDHPDTAPVHYYRFLFRSRSGIDSGRARLAIPPTLLDWSDLPMKKTDKGESRQIFDRPLASLSRIDMHATTLNEGQVSHPPHIHRNEEIILVRHGETQEYIQGKYIRAGAGDIIFLTSGTPHALENKTRGVCEYFALQWTD